MSATTRIAVPFAAAAVLLLAACTAAPAATDEAAPPSPSAAATAEPPAAASPEPIAACAGIELETGAVVDGAALGECVTQAMLAAGTGTQRVESDGTASIVDFRWEPEFSMSIDSGDTEVVLTGDRGWLRADGGWIEADRSSTDPEVALATTIVEAVRVTADPRTLAGYFALSPSWTVVGEEAVPADDAVRERAWLLRPEDGFSAGGVRLDGVGFWLGDDHLGALFEATATVGGVSATTRDVFLQWGGPVDISDPRG